MSDRRIKPSFWFWLIAAIVIWSAVTFGGALLVQHQGWGVQEDTVIHVECPKENS